MPNNIAVEMRNISKSFGSLKALDDVSLKVEYGTIHAILGENGAGKSTLMRILFGMLTPDKGKVLINGKEVNLKDAKDASALKIGMVHQHFKLVNDFTVFENITLGVEKSKFGLLQEKDSLNKIKEFSKKYGIYLDLSAKVRDISVGMQQRTEIMKILYREANILIFDEPTAVLTPQEIETFLSIIKNLKKEGKAIILITHKLEEIHKAADVCTVLRKGKTIKTFNPNEVTSDEMAEMMVGRQVSFKTKKSESHPGKVVLEINNYSCLKDKSKKMALDDINFSIREGEIVAIAGVEGNGQEDLINIILGMKKGNKQSGSIILYDKEIKDSFLEMVKNRKDDYFNKKMEIKALLSQLRSKEEKSISDKENQIISEQEKLPIYKEEGTKEALLKLKETKVTIKRLNKELKSLKHIARKSIKEGTKKIFLENKEDLEKKKVLYEVKSMFCDKAFKEKVKERKKDLTNHLRLATLDYQRLIRENKNKESIALNSLKSSKKEYIKKLKAIKKKYPWLKREFNEKARISYIEEVKSIHQSLEGQIASLKSIIDERESLKQNYQNLVLSLKEEFSQFKDTRKQVGFLDLLNSSIKTKRKHGLAIIPSDRLKEGLILSFSVEDNLILSKVKEYPFSRLGIISNKAKKNHAEHLIKEYDIRSSDGRETKANDMSGGNQQKVIIARETEKTPRLLIANQPSRGLDVGAIENVNSILIKKRDEGAAILLYSTELEDIMNLADRILVINEGRITAELDPKKTNFMEIGYYMSSK